MEGGGWLSDGWGWETAQGGGTGGGIFRGDKRSGPGGLKVKTPHSPLETHFGGFAVWGFWGFRYRNGNQAVI